MDNIVKKKTVKKGGSAKAWEIGSAITAATLAAAAGAYLLSGKKTKAKAKKWAMEARKEVVKNVKIARKLGEKEYGRMVDEAMKHHAALEKDTPVASMGSVIRMRRSAAMVAGSLLR